MIPSRLMMVIFLLSLPLTNQAMADTSVNKAGTDKVKKARSCYFPKTKKKAPNWVCSGTDSSMAVTAVGTFHKSGAGIEFMQQMAATDARVNLAKKLRAPVQKKIAESEGGVAGDSVLINKITDEQLQGTKVIKSVYGPKGKLYVLMGLDEAGAQKLQEAVAADYLAQKRR